MKATKWVVVVFCFQNYSSVLKDYSIYIKMWKCCVISKFWKQWHRFGKCKKEKYSNLHVHYHISFSFFFLLSDFFFIFWGNHFCLGCLFLAPSVASIWFCISKPNFIVMCQNLGHYSNCRSLCKFLPLYLRQTGSQIWDIKSSSAEYLIE